MRKTTRQKWGVTILVNGFAISIFLTIVTTVILKICPKSKRKNLSSFMFLLSFVSLQYFPFSTLPVFSWATPLINRNLTRCNMFFVVYSHLRGENISIISLLLTPFFGSSQPPTDSLQSTNWAWKCKEFRFSSTVKKSSFATFFC